MARIVLNSQEQFLGSFVELAFVEMGRADRD